VKEAILMIMSGISHERAVSELALANGILRIAIENTTQSES
jgi:N-acetylmuramic acid 6-phosphate (MurNAc-6-P) etherase